MSDEPEIRPEEEQQPTKSGGHLGLISVLLLLLIALVVYYFYLKRHDPGFRPWNIAQPIPSGDPAKLARALITIASHEPPPRRFIAGADAIATAEQKVADLKAQIDANRALSTSLAFG